MQYCIKFFADNQSCCSHLPNKHVFFASTFFVESSTVYKIIIFYGCHDTVPNTSHFALLCQNYYLAFIFFVVLFFVNIVQFFIIFVFILVIV